MRVLLIDTCGVEGTVAVAVDGRVVGGEVLAARAASEGLMPAIRRLMGGAGWETVDAVGVVSGPGSFTGLRTGLAVAKGLCEVWGVPLVAVSRLAVLAGGEGVVHAVLDAGRGEFYVGSYRDGVMEREALVGRAELDGVLAGGGRVVACEEKVLLALAGTGVEGRTEPSAGEALGLVMARLAAGEDDLLGDANYLRRTDAEIFAKPVKG